MDSMVPTLMDPESSFDLHLRAGARGVIERLCNSGLPQKKWGTFQIDLEVPIHRWFGYIAGFAPELVAEQIKQHATPGSAVFDPFLGAGTTAVVARSMGYPTYGIEVSPLMAWVCKTKMNWHLDNEEIRGLASLPPVTAEVESDFTPAQERTYTEGVLHQIRFLLDAGARLDGDLQALHHLALLSILKPISSYKNFAPYLEPRSDPRPDPDVVSLFIERMEMFVSDLTLVQELPDPGVEIVCGDSRDPASYPDDLRAGLLVTSPPYLNNWEYSTITKLELEIYDFLSPGRGDRRILKRNLVRSSTYLPRSSSSLPSSAVGDEIVALQDILREIESTKRFPKLYSTLVGDYFSDMFQVLKHSIAVMQPGATGAVVVGDSGLYGTHVPTDRWLGALAEIAGWSEVDRIKIRDRRATRHQLPLQETLILLQAPSY